MQRYIAAAPVTELYEGGAKITIDNMYDEVWFLVRFNGQTPANVQGGTLTQLTDSLYLLYAYKSIVNIEF